MSEFIDPLIGSVAMRGAYDASSRYSAELAMWSPPFQSADLDMLPEKTIMDVRVRDTLRNDAFVQAGATIRKDHIVGEMFMLNAKPNFKVLGLDEVWAEEFQEEAEAKFTLYAESPKNYPDASRMQTLTGMVRMAVGIHTMAGEVLASVEWMRGVRPFATAMQMIDVDRLSNPYGDMDTRFLRRGVHKDKFGAPLGYWIRTSHPTDFTDTDNYTWKYVPATRGQVVGIDGWDRPQMIHIVDQWRPDQSRGLSMMVSALKEMKMTRKFRDVVLQNAVLNASYAASIESDLPTDVVMQQAGGGDASAVANYATAYLSAIAQYTGAGRGFMIDGVKVPHFFPGTKMKLQNAGTPGGVGSTFEQSLLRYIAAALEVSYPELSRDFSQSNYSTIRAELAQTDRRMRVQKKAVADRFASTFYRLWLEEALNRKEITAMPKNAPNWYEGLNADAYSVCDWIGAAKGQIEQLKETQAAVLRLNNNLGTLEDELAALGKDWRSVLRQKAREKKMMDELGLTVEDTTKNMVNAASGTPGDEGDAPRSAMKEDDE